MPLSSYGNYLKCCDFATRHGLRDPENGAPITELADGTAEFLQFNR
jgi:hypothetical protein